MNITKAANAAVLVLAALPLGLAPATVAAAAIQPVDGQVHHVPVNDDNGSVHDLWSIPGMGR
ncbi:hypothetical protein [Saccharothrix stipae]